MMMKKKKKDTLKLRIVRTIYETTPDILITRNNATSKKKPSQIQWENFEQLIESRNTFMCWCICVCIHENHFLSPLTVLVGLGCRLFLFSISVFAHQILCLFHSFFLSQHLPFAIQTLDYCEMLRATFGILLQKAYQNTKS